MDNWVEILWKFNPRLSARAVNALSRAAQYDGLTLEKLLSMKERRIRFKHCGKKTGHEIYEVCRKYEAELKQNAAPPKEKLAEKLDRIIELLEKIAAK